MFKLIPNTYHKKTQNLQTSKHTKKQQQQNVKVIEFLITQTFGFHITMCDDNEKPCKNNDDNCKPCPVLRPEESCVASP